MPRRSSECTFRVFSHYLINNPFTLTLLSALFCLAFLNFKFDGPGTSHLDLQWAGCLLLVALLPRIPVLVGISIGHWFSRLCLSEAFHYPMHIAFEIVFYISLILSLTILILLKDKLLVHHWGFTLTILIPITVVTGFALNNFNNKYILLSASATIIIGILSLLKARYLHRFFWTLFLPWLSGYTLFSTLIWLFQLDPDTKFLSDMFFINMILIPFPVFLLELLLAAHILQAVWSDERINS